MLTKDKEDYDKRHLCVVKNNYMSESNKSESYVLEFNDHLAFENTGKRVLLDSLGEDEMLDKAKQFEKEGYSLREITQFLNAEGFSISKSSLHRKMS